MISFSDNQLLPVKVEIYCQSFNKNDCLHGGHGLKNDIHELENAAKPVSIWVNIALSSFSFNLRATDPNFTINSMPDLQIAVSYSIKPRFSK